jgi:hypothetical protein
MLVIRDADKSYEQKYQSVSEMIREIFNETSEDILHGYCLGHGVSP